ncbi:MAG TPA: hypothetical protein VFF72_07275 [Caldimonas sp.]|nr:hypothetical protein [Caldimonas sp.]
MTSSPFVASRGVVVAFCLAMLAGAAAAKTGKPQKQPILTPAQLRACVAQKDDLHAKTDEALKDKNVIGAEKAEIERSAAALGGEVATLDRTSASAVDAYNGKVAERDRRIDAYQAHVDAYNDKAKALQSLQDAYSRACENRRYDENDLPGAKRKK